MGVGLFGESKVLRIVIFVVDYEFGGHVFVLLGLLVWPSAWLPWL